MKDSIMQIVCCADHNYVMPCGVMLKSLFLNNCKTKIRIHLIVDKTITNDDIDSIRTIVETESGGSLSVYNFDEIGFDVFPNLGNHTHISKAAYYRLFLASILPLEIEKVLYLDVDLVVLDNLSDLWDTNIVNYAFGGVIDQETDAIEHYNRMKYKKEDGMMNSGVLLINLKYWREHSLENCFLDFIIQHQDRIRYHDQDVLNCVLHGQKILLPLKYNVQSAFYYRKDIVKYDMDKYQNEVEEAKRNPVILHFSTNVKPWNEDCFHPMKYEFVKYQSMTKWKGVVNEMKVERMSFRQVLYDVLLLLGIKKRKKVYESRWKFE